MSVLGLGKDLVKAIKDKLSREVAVTPNLVRTTSRHWDSTNSVIIQNKTEKPLFSVQVVFWHEKNQNLEFRLEELKKEARINDIVINYGIVILRGEAAGESVAILEILRLKPKESIEIDLQIEKPGSVKIFPANYDSKQSKQVFSSKDKFGYPFTTPPFDMQIASIGLLLRKTAS